MMRICQIGDYFHIDLSKVIAIHQCMDLVKNKNRNGHSDYDCWIEIIMDNGKIITIERRNIEKLVETYDLLLKAWQTYVGDLPEDNSTQYL